jgi:general secretion pathway protein D
MNRYLATFLLFYSLAFSSDKFINANFKNLSLIELVNIISLKTDTKILVSNKLVGKVNFISKNPVKKADLLDILKASLSDNGYELVRYKKDIFKIEKNDKKSLKDLLDTKIISLMNIDAKNIKNILQELIKKRAYKTKPTITMDEQNNTIILDGLKDEVENLSSIVKKLDVEKTQVYVKAKIVEIDDNLVEDIGFKLGILGGKIFSGGILTFASSLNDGAALNIDTSSIGLQIPNMLSSLALGASLNLLNKTYALDIVSQPSILCTNNNESMIYVGETVSIQTGSTITDGGTTNTVFEREDIGLTLKVKPRISLNKVMLNINTTVEGIKNENNLSYTPDTSKKEIKTIAIVNNGESVILGGLIETKSEKSIQKIPLAGDIPLIGELFKNRLNDSRNKNLVVIITPYIIPKEKDLSYVRRELSKLKILEDDFLKKVLLELKKRKNKELSERKVQSDVKKHQARLKKYFGI